jgi:phosphoesterase RecJ-like protein
MSVFELKKNKGLIAELQEALHSPQKIVIVTHFNPDGDAMGSTLGLAHLLKKQKHKVQVICPNPWPSFLNWMHGTDEVLNHEFHKKKAEKYVSDADYIFCLDFNTPNRVGTLEEALIQAKGTKILIDHHQQPGNFAQYIFSDTTACSTCQMIYQFAACMGLTEGIDREAANCLYTGIMTDTGSFRFRGTTAETHRVIAALIDAGAENTLIPERVFDAYTADRLQLLGYCLSEKLQLLGDFNTAFICLTEPELTRHNFQKGDTEGIVNYPLSIGNVKFSAFFVEREGEIKISFRSKGDFDVNQFARKHFIGGGHKNAAGAKSDDTLDETISRFILALSSYKEELHQL